MKNAIISENKITHSTIQNMKALRERIKGLRKEKGMTQLELSEKLGVSRSCVAAWEKGDRIPDVYNLKDLVLLFDVTSDYMLGFVDDKKGERKIYDR